MAYWNTQSTTRGYLPVAATFHQALPFDPLRDQILIDNNGGVTLYVYFGDTPTTADSIEIPAGGSIGFVRPSIQPMWVST